jgi:hypothetical protein
MANTVSTIQDRVRWESRDSNFDLTSTDGQTVLNGMYRRLASIIPWPELNRSDTSASTTVNQESVTWPSVKFIDVTNIEIQDPDRNLNYQTIVPARTEAEWSELRNQDASFPQLYKRSHDGTQNVILFAPKPDAGSLTVRVTGQIEPTAITAAASTTVFISDIPDDILAYMIAADIAAKRSQPQRAQELIRMSAELLSAIAGKEITPAELKSDTENG